MLGAHVSWGAARSVLPSPRDALEVFAAQAGLNPLPPGRHFLREQLEELEGLKAGL